MCSTFLLGNTDTDQLSGKGSHSNVRSISPTRRRSPTCCILCLYITSVGCCIIRPTRVGRIWWCMIPSRDDWRAARRPEDPKHPRLDRRCPSIRRFRHQRHHYPRSRVPDRPWIEHIHSPRQQAHLVCSAYRTNQTGTSGTIRA